MPLFNWLRREINRMNLSLMRLRGFLRKEFLQIKRDPSSILLGILMPVVLLLLFGYGISLDPKNVPIAVVIEKESSQTRDLAARFDLSSYFSPIYFTSMQEAIKSANNIDGIIRVPSNFDKDHAIQLIANGIDANRARLIEGYVQGLVANWLSIEAARRGEQPPFLHVQPRVWFNENINSSHFLVPGLLALIMTIIGTLLTALVIAREWERGTMENILATPLRTHEILLGKLLPYFAIGIAGMLLSTLLGLSVFGVPLRGSVTLLLLFSSIFLCASLGLGLFISAITRVQFIAAMASILAGFLPALFLSGLLFDLGSTPIPIQWVSYLVPAKYFVTIAQTIFLAGNVWPVILPAAAILSGMASLLLFATLRKIPRRLK
ncbi:conserved hypothetical protein [Desulfotalea psychrophila LSv54]|uniref:ABC transmembrane type-2 domain-containing protein n=2 Tax=Desulfotalea psychrophila TaxID=84980 RepID=Q6AN02_DESPS|nr:conserved hypothetical protein [Desulfotalea psychrophila LSv54]